MTQQTRKDPRAKVLSMTVRYKSATLDEFIEHHSHDVSRGGMFIKTPQPFPPGTLLKFEVRIAEDRKVMQGVGRVVWKRDLTAADGERPAGMGVKFIKLDDDSRRLIDQLLATRHDESSAYDAEGSQPGLDTEATVGLGTDPISIPAPRPSSPETSFFPKSEPAELPPPEDRTVMKQAAELLEEALREVGTSPSPAKPPAPSEDEREDTKPGRQSKPNEAAARPPEPKSPATASRGATAAAPVKTAPKPTSLSPGKPAPPTRGNAANLVSVAQELTDKAREIAASKSPPATSAKPAPKPPVASNKPNRQAAAAAPVAASAQPAAVVSPKTPAKGTSRGVFWAVAVAACAAVTWWIWSKPETAADSAPNEAPAAQEPRAAVANPTPAENQAPVASVAEAAPAPSASAVAEASAAPSDASAMPSAAPEPAPAVAPPPQEQPKEAIAAPAPAPAPKAPVARVAKKAAAAEQAAPAANEANAAAESPPVANDAPAAPAAPAEKPAAEPKPAEPAPAEPKPVESKPAAPPEEPAAKPAPPPEAPAAAPKAPAKKAKAPASDSNDNPY